MLPRRRILKNCLLCVIVSITVSCGTSRHAVSNRFGGIGVSVSLDSASGISYISAVISGSPAAISGLRSGDQIIKIDNRNLKGKSDLRVSKTLRGKPGSELILSVKRGSQTYSIRLERAIISIDPDSINFCSGLQQLFPFVGNSHPAKGFHLKNMQSEIFTVDGYSAVFYFGADSVEANRKFRELRTDVYNCMLNTLWERADVKKWFSEGKSYYQFKPLEQKNLQSGERMKCNVLVTEELPESILGFGTDIPKAENQYRITLLVNYSVQ